MESVTCYEAQLPAELGSVVAARRLVDSALASWGIAGTAAEDAALVVSELVTNAVLHTGTVLSVRVRRLDPGIQLEVQDGSTQPPVGPADRTEELLTTSSMTGRGLALLAATVDRWGTDPRPDGKVVWAVIGTGGGAPGGSDAPPPAGALLEPAASSQTIGGATVIPAGAGGGGRRVRLVGVPVGLLIESVQQFADLQRELQVVELDHNGPPELLDFAESNRGISARIGSLRHAGASVAEAALVRGEAVVDFDVDVADGAVEAFDRLGSLIRRMDNSLGRHLLSMPPSEEVTAYRLWYRNEISAQLQGRAPQRCPFALI